MHVSSPLAATRTCCRDNQQADHPILGRRYRRNKSRALTAGRRSALSGACCFSYISPIQLRRLRYGAACERRSQRVTQLHCRHARAENASYARHLHNLTNRDRCTHITCVMLSSRSPYAYRLRNVGHHDRSTLSIRIVLAISCAHVFVSRVSARSQSMSRFRRQPYCNVF